MVLVAEVQKVLTGDVAKKVHRRVEVGDGDNLPTNVVVDPAHSVCVYETITNPKTGLHSVVDFTDQLQHTT